jgi:hypothetical protein
MGHAPLASGWNKEAKEFILQSIADGSQDTNERIAQNKAINPSVPKQKPPQSNRKKKERIILKEVVINFLYKESIQKSRKFEIQKTRIKSKQQQRRGCGSDSILANRRKQSCQIPWLNAIEAMNEVTTINHDRQQQQGEKYNQTDGSIPKTSLQRTRNPLQAQCHKQKHYIQRRKL